MRKRLYLCLALVLGSVGATVAQSNASLKFQSTTQQTALLELYTSEGCSSCPPAEVWLSGLQTSPRLWQDFAPVAFHVDYWNSLGWKDAWSDPAFGERQRAYAQTWRSENIYTPEYVLNGREWHHWLTGKNGPATDGKPAGILSVTSADTNLWLASYRPEKPTESHYEIHAALLVGEIISDVKAGENAGRTLRHDFVVVNLVQVGLTTSHGSATGKFITDTARFRSGKTLGLTVWVTRAGELESLQTTGGWIIAPPQN